MGIKGTCIEVCIIHRAACLLVCTTVRSVVVLWSCCLCSALLLSHMSCFRAHGGTAPCRLRHRLHVRAAVLVDGQVDLVDSRTGVKFKFERNGRVQQGGGGAG